jgi:RNA polymerase sigma factor (sigma-70 family)
MPTRGLSRVVEHLRAVARPPDASLTDGQLLARFAAERDEDAFTALVRRHGSMVWGVCRRVLHHVQDAEDAFQAAFLVLAQKAAAVARYASVGGWLYRVAERAAGQARTAGARRRGRERLLGDLPDAEAAPAEPQDWRAVLHQEVERLPAAYRAAVVLCELEERPRREAARLLGVPEGTLSSRLAAARRLLSRRLAHRGLAPAALSLAALWAGGASAAPPAALAASTARAAALFVAGRGAVAAPAAVLTKEVLKAMFMTKVKVVLSLSVLAAVVGAGAFTYRAGGQEPGRAAAADARDKADADALRAENERLRKQLEKAEVLCKSLQERLAAVEASHKKATAEREVLLARAEALRAQAEAIQEQAEEARRAEARALLAAKGKADADDVALRKENERLRKELEESKRQLDELQAKLAKVEKTLAQALDEKTKLLEEARALRDQALAARQDAEDRARAAKAEYARALEAANKAVEKYAREQEKQSDDAAGEVQAALKAFRAAKDKDARLKAAEALEKAVKRLKDSIK